MDGCSLILHLLVCTYGDEVIVIQLSVVGEEVYKPTIFPTLFAVIYGE